MDGYTELTSEKIATPEGINEVNECNCVWQELPNQTGAVRGSVLVTECEPCKTRREEQAAIEAAKQAEANSPYKKFDYTIFEGRMIQVLPQERWFTLAVSTGVAYSMMRLIEYPGRSVDNFTRFKAFIAGLVAQSTLSADEQGAISSLFLEQGIDLAVI